MLKMYQCVLFTRTGECAFVSGEYRTIPAAAEALRETARNNPEFVRGEVIEVTHRVVSRIPVTPKRKKA